jgi:DnaJ-class molecular chaperone
MAEACKECGGIGKVPETLPCRTCRGRGFITGKPPKPCPSCRDGQVRTGRNVTCTDCNGTGKEPDLW